MYEGFYGLRKEPFSLTPDPNFFYRGEAHAGALDLVHQALRRREGPMVITGTSGTGKTTTCRRVLEEVGRKTVWSLVLNPYVSDEDLLRLILEDFGVISREDRQRRGRARIRGSQLMQTLEEFLLSLRPIGAQALLILDEAQKLPVRVLEQVQRLSGLSVGSERLLQIVMAGQLGLMDRLRALELRHLESRVVSYCRLRTLTSTETSSYIRHRMAIAGDLGGVTFTTGALQTVHRATAGNPRLINLVCDHALLGAYAVSARQVQPDAVAKAAAAIGLQAEGGPAGTVLGWMRGRVAAF